MRSRIPFSRRRRYHYIDVIYRSVRYHWYPIYTVIAHISWLFRRCSSPWHVAVTFYGPHLRVKVRRMSSQTERERERERHTFVVIIFSSVVTPTTCGTASGRTVFFLRSLLSSLIKYNNAISCAGSTALQDEKIKQNVVNTRLFPTRVRAYIRSI